MRRKFGILILVGITMLAGTQEAVRQFDGLRSSLNNFTRASLWSGLIVYAQPVSDGKVPAPQIYYLMPQPQQTSPAPHEALLVENNPNVTAAKPEAKNNHVAEEMAATGAEALTAREVEDAAKSELVLDKLPAHVPSHVIANHIAAAASKLEKVRVYEEVARNEAGARRFRTQDAEVIARGFVKEFDAAKLEAELARLAAVQEQLENTKLKSFGDAEHVARRLDLKVLRRAPRPERPEQRLERIRVIAPYADKRAIMLPEISSIGCEKVTSEAEATAAVGVEATVAVTGLATSVMLASEPTVAAAAIAPVAPVEPSLPAAVITAPLTTSTSWALGCDTEPEFK